MSTWIASYQRLRYSPSS